MQLLPRSFQPVSIGERHHHMSPSPRPESHRNKPPWRHGTTATWPALSTWPRLCRSFVARSAPRFSGWSRVYFLLGPTVFLLRYVSPWGTSASQKLSDAPIALIGPQCFSHCASNPAYALPLTAKPYADKTRIHSTASIIDIYNAAAL